MGLFTGYQGTTTVNDNRCNIMWTVTTCGTNAVTDTAVTAPWIDYNNAITTNTTIYRPQYQVMSATSDYATYIDAPTQVTVRYNWTGDAAATNNVFRFIQTTVGDILPVPKTAADKLREILEKRVAPNIISSCKPLGFTQDEREMRARETLRRVLGEQKFRDFVRRGSISIRAKSGMVYQIFPGHDFTKVYNCGKLVDRLCVVLQGNFPPTDSLIMRYLMILNNEQQFRSYAIKHGVDGLITLPQKPDQRTLVEIFKELKLAA
jgi:hypothetical protein